MTYAAPFNYDAWKLAAPEEPEESRRNCGNCLFCKMTTRTLECVEEIFNARDEDALYRAELHEVTEDQEPCDKWKDGE